MDNVNPILSASAFSALLARSQPSRRAEPVSAVRRPQPLPLPNDIDVLDLSPLAQSFLDRFGVGSANDNASLLGTASSDRFGFFLTQEQEQKISDILAAHKGEPLNQKTFQEILAELTAVGLSPQQLAAQDLLQSFNPLGALLDTPASGTTNYFSNTLNIPYTGGTIPSEQANINAYTLQILTQFLGFSVV